MGIIVSKLWQCIKREETIEDVENQALYAAEIKSYLAACEMDPELRAFDGKMQRRMTKAMSSLTEGVDVRSMSLDSLKEVAGCLCMMNHEVVKVILNCRQDIWNTPDLFELVEDYFENSLQTLDFLAALKKCLVKARDSQLILQVALQCFHNDDRDHASTNKYERTLEELKRFEETCNPFNNEFFQAFNAVYGQQQLMIEKLILRKLKLDKRLKTLKAFRRISSIIFASAYTALVICSVVAAAVAPPAVTAALSAATSSPLGSMGKWFDSLCEKYENNMKSQRDAVASMQVGTFVVIKDLECVRVLIERLEVRIGTLLQSAEFAVKEEEEEGVGIAVCEMSKMLEGFMENVEEIGELAARCCRDIRRARTVVLERIMG